MATGGRAPVALVTGGRRGIGRGIAVALAEAGFDIVAADLAEDEDARATLEAVRARGRRAAFLVADIARIEARDELASRVFAAFGALDCLVNNAGVQVDKRGDMLDVTPESFDRVIGVNLRGTFFLTQAIARRMVAETRAKGDPPRSIVTISSINALFASPNRPEYCFSKTSLAMMTQMLALRLAPHGIAAYDIRPGVIRTAITRPVAETYGKWIPEHVPEARWGEPEDIGRTIAALASGALPFATGNSIYVDGGLHLPTM
jgi:NAD(P)-dependent dehydrogenase (short-subunit alcohol dehydrogenase family)